MPPVKSPWERPQRCKPKMRVGKASEKTETDPTAKRWITLKGAKFFNPTYGDGNLSKMQMQRFVENFDHAWYFSKQYLPPSFHSFVSCRVFFSVRVFCWVPWQGKEAIPAICLQARNKTSTDVMEFMNIIDEAGEIVRIDTKNGACFGIQGFPPLKKIWLVDFLGVSMFRIFQGLYLCFSIWKHHFCWNQSWPWECCNQWK